MICLTKLRTIAHSNILVVRESLLGARFPFLGAGKWVLVVRSRVLVGGKSFLGAGVSRLVVGSGFLVVRQGVLGAGPWLLVGGQYLSSSNPLFPMKNLFATWLRLLVVVGLLGTAGQVAAQAPGWQMALAIGTPTGSISEVTATAADASGYVFLTGSFTGTVTFGATTLTSSPASSDLFVAKWSPATGFVWAQRAGGTRDDYALAVAVSGSSVYVTGHFRSPTLAFGTTTLTNFGYTDGFVAKLTDAGSTSTWTWAQAMSWTVDEAATAVAVSGSSVYVAGYFNSPTLPFGATTLTNAGSGDVFVAKLTDAGSTSTWTWAQAVGGMDGEAATAVAVSGGSVYVAGHFLSATLPFGATTLINATTGRADVFVAKLTDAGSTSTWTWAQAVGGTSVDQATTVAVSGGNVYVAGFFQSPTISFGSTTLANAATGRDVFVAKLTDAGNTSAWTWAQAVGGTSDEAALALAVSGGSVYAAGYFASPTLPFGATTLTNAGSTGSFSFYVFVAKLTDAGSTATWSWAQAAGGTAFDFVYGLAVSGGSVYAAGSFSSPTIPFGSTTLVNTSISGSLISTGFLAALTDPLLAIPSEATVAPFTLTPNPAHTTVTLTGLALTEPTATLFDGLGRVVHTVPLIDGGATLDVRGLAAGLYVVRAGNRAQRLVVE